MDKIKALATWMGWTVKKYRLPLEGTRIWIFRDDEPWIHLDNWNPLENIQDAWMLVEKIQEHPKNIGKDIHIEALNGRWSVSCCYELGWWKDWVHGDTVQEAICAAALELIEAEMGWMEVS